MKQVHGLVAFLALAAWAKPVQAADITGTVTLDGTAPPEAAITEILADPVCSKLHPEPMTTHFYVVGANKGLRDVVVYLDGVSGKSTGASAPPVVLDQKNCEYTPYIFAVQTGQKILIRNSDPATVPMHNIHVVPNKPGNDEQNIPQPSGDPDKPLVFAHAEDFITFKCDVHPWMRSWVTVVDHPWFAVTDAEGKFKISNVPAGKYSLKAIHRKASGGKGVLKDVEVKDATVTVDYVLEAPK